MTLHVEPVTPTLGGIVTGVDLATASDADVEALRRAVLDRKVVFAPAQHLAPDAQIALARRLGEIEVAPFGPKHPDHPEMTVLDQVAPRGEGADAWHTDNTYLPRPPSYTVLQAVQLPPLGGDTCFADMAAAYDALSPPLQQLLEGLTATHDLTRTLRRAIADGNSDADLADMQRRWPPVHHPVVRVHPDTGRRSLFVNGNFTTRLDGLTRVENDGLLPMLLAHVGSPLFQCRHRWTPGTLTIWDNRCVQHYAVPDYDRRRVMHRLTVGGDEPRGVDQ